MVYLGTFLAWFDRHDLEYSSRGINYAVFNIFRGFSDYTLGIYVRIMCEQCTKPIAKLQVFLLIIFKVLLVDNKSKR